MTSTTPTAARPPGGRTEGVATVAGGPAPRGGRRWGGAAACVLAMLSTACSDRRPAERPAGAGAASHTILVDNIHSLARDQIQHLQRGQFSYLALHGMGRLFDHLASNGYATRYVTRDDAHELTADVLRGVDILFVDLLGLHSLDYSAREVEVVRRWVERGGGLLVASDHTNVYDNARRVNALLEPMGIRVTYSTAIDRVPDFANPEGSYLKVRRFGTHPVTRGVRAITYLGGATLATQHGVAFLSEGGFSDFWAEGRPPRHLGNWRRDPSEEAGSLPLLAARDFGAGRVVVLGDENLLGNQQLFMADNFALVTNLFAWLAGLEAAPPALHAPPPARLRVGFALEPSGWNVYGQDCDFYHPFYITFNQTPGVMAAGLLDLDGDWDVLVFTDPAAPLDAAGRRAVAAHLAAGGTVVVLTDVVRTRPGARQLLVDLVPDVVVEGRSRISVQGLPAPERVETLTAAEEWPAVSPALAVGGLHVAGQEYPGGLRCPWDVGKTRPYLRRIRASGGEPLLQAEVRGGVVDVARTYAVGGGTVVVFFQDGVFRNETLGWAEHVPTGRTIESFRIAYAFIDWLLERHGARGRAGAQVGR